MQFIQKTYRFSALKEKSIKVLWAFFILALPITSFPFLPAEFGGAASVRPLSFYPLLGLLVLVTLPRFFKKPLPKVFLPLLVFALFAVSSALLASLNPAFTLRDVSPTLRLIRGLVALGVGLAFYFTVSLYPQSWSDLKDTLRWLYIGFSIALLWGTIQISYILKIAPELYHLLSQMQRLISSRKLMLKRISGLTYEPKWFAEQICFLLMPWLLASVLSGCSVFRWRWRGLSVEFFLLAWASVVLLFTYSRSGLFVLFVLFLLGGWLTRDKLIRHIKHWEAKSKINSKLLLACGLGVILLIAALMIYVVGMQNNYFSRLWTYWSAEQEARGDYLEYIAFRQRMVYAETAYRMYEAYPILGVGLGNYAFFFESMLPNRPWHRQPDILRQLSQEEGRTKLITPKNLFVKILAESGTLGFAAFGAFCLTLLGIALSSSNTQDSFHSMWSKAGIFGLAAFAVFSFSYDSFVIPNMWVIFGLITAANQLREDETSAC